MNDSESFAPSQKDLERFWSRVLGEPGNACWEWQGGRTSSGYGRFAWKVKGKQFSQGPHRVSYRLHCGPIPEGLCVCHSCNNKICVNPAHLYLATLTENLQHARDAGLCIPPNNQGEHNPHSKLTQEDVIALRELWRSGIPRAEIADQFNISPRHAARIARYESWKHVP